MMYRQYYGGFGGGRRITPAVKTLLIANLAVFLLQILIQSSAVWEIFGLIPGKFWKLHLWQPVTYMFLHAGFMHLFFNMFALWMFGTFLESYWGTREFTKYYFLTGIGAGLSNCLLTPGSDVVIIGASGAVYALLAAYGILFPNTTIYVSFLFPVKAKYLVLFFGLFEFFMSINTLAGTSSTIAHVVHLGGMVIGIIYLKNQDILRWGARNLKKMLHRRDRQRNQKERYYEEKLKDEIDEILDKINEVGIGNLTPAEIRKLNEASEKLKKMQEQEDN